MKEKIKQQLEQLNERERKMVYAAAIVLLIFLPYQVIWAPFMHSIDSLNEKVQLQENDLLWMQAKVPEIREVSSKSRAATVGSGSIYAVIEKTARNKFGSEIRVQQEGKSGIRVTIDDTGFDDMVIWLDELHVSHGVYIKEFKVDREDTAGHVKANILIEG